MRWNGLSTIDTLSRKKCNNRNKRERIAISKAAKSESEHKAETYVNDQEKFDHRFINLDFFPCVFSFAWSILSEINFQFVSCFLIGFRQFLLSFMQNCSISEWNECVELDGNTPKKHTEQQQNWVESNNGAK